MASSRSVEDGSQSLTVESPSNSFPPENSWWPEGDQAREPAAPEWPVRTRSGCPLSTVPSSDTLKTRMSPFKSPQASLSPSGAHAREKNVELPS